MDTHLQSLTPPLLLSTRKPTHTTKLSSPCAFAALPMSSQQQQKRVGEQQDGEHPNGAKRSRALAIVDVEVKQEQLRQGGEEAGQGFGQGEEALVPVVQTMEMEEPQINIRMAVSRLHCHGCVLPLKPPIFKCEAGHAVCSACRGSHARACAVAGTYVHCTLLDEIVRDAKVPCAYEAYGCGSWVVYYEAPDHHRSCRFAPCFCPVPGCGHFTSPARLAEHFSSDHGWPVSTVDYSKPYKFAVPGPQQKLVLVGKADECVFLVAPRALSEATAVSSLVCVRACGDAAAGAPQYRCRLWTEVAGHELTVTSMVASSDMASGVPATDQGIFLQDKSGEPSRLMIRIDKVGVPAASARSRSPSATPPSTLPRTMPSPTSVLGSV